MKAPAAADILRHNVNARGMSREEEKGCGLAAGSWMKKFL